MDKLVKCCLIFLICMALTSCVTLSYKYGNFSDKKPRSYRLATYNIFRENRSCNKNTRDSTVRLFNTIDADILLIQESTPFWKACLKHYLKKKYPYQLFQDYKAHDREDGLAILSRYPIIRHHLMPPVYGWFPASHYLISTPSGTLDVLNVHLNPPLISENNIGFMGEALFTTPKKRENEIIYFTQNLPPNLPTIIAGDFNESDSGRALQYLKRRCYCDGLSFVPSRIITWRWKILFLNLFGRYDHVMYSPRIQPLNCQVLQEGSSDHFPVVLDFRFSPCFVKRS